MIEDDAVLRALAQLKAIPSDPKREERVRARCHDEMMRGARTTSRFIDAAAVIALFCYLSVVLLNAARLAGVL